MARKSWDDSPIAAAARRAAQVKGPNRPTLPRPDAPRRIAVANQKGGVGKTTSAVNFASALAHHGLKVLLIDNDPQGNASTAVDVDHRSGTTSTYEVLIGEAEPAEAMQQSPESENLWCIPATLDLAGSEIELVNLFNRERRLRQSVTDEFLREHGFDYLIIDCPPSLGLLTLNSMTAAAEVIIPIQCEFYALEGVTQLLNNVQMIRQHLNPELHISAVLLTMYDGRTKLADEVVGEVRKHFGEAVCATSSLVRSRCPRHPATAKRSSAMTRVPVARSPTWTPPRNSRSAGISSPPPRAVPSASHPRTSSRRIIT